MKSFSVAWGGVLLLVLLASPAWAQRIGPSPLVVNVSREKTESGRNTVNDYGYSSSKSYARQVALKIAIRNMSTNAVDTRVEAYFVADPQGSGGDDRIYCHRETNAVLAAREARDFATASDPLSSQVYQSAYYNYKSGDKFKGYLVRVLAQGSLVEVVGSTPSLQKLGWDDKALKKMLGVREDGAEAPAGAGANRPPPAGGKRPPTSF